MEKTHCPVCRISNNLTYCDRCAKKFQPPIEKLTPENCMYFKRLPMLQIEDICTKKYGPANQHWYNCRDCFPNNPFNGYCIHCAKNCQKTGHRLQLYYSTFICDNEK